MQPGRDPAQREERPQIRGAKRLGLEDALQERDVDERELDQERRRDRRDQHPVLREAAAEPAVLYRGDEVEEYKASECLYIPDKYSA